MLSASHIVVTAVVAVIVLWVMKGVRTPPEVTPEDELESEGLSPQKMRQERRSQRGEHRNHSTTKSQALRAISAAQRVVTKIVK
jgi:hypothetical protein